MEFSKKFQNLSSSVTLEITKIANEMKSKGENVISFAAGEPDFNTPENIQIAAFKAIKNGKIRYTAVSGLGDLKKAIIEKLKKDNGLRYEENQILVSTGAKQCLANVFMGIINDGDEVIIPGPYWVSYPELVKISGGKPVFLYGSEKNDFKITGEDLEKVCNEKTKAIIINSPSNPTGIVYSKEELLELANVAKKKDIFIISDEIYEKIIYNNEKHISIASLSEDAYERTIVINGFSKSYAMTGWRIGYVAGNKKLIEIINKIQSHMTSNANTISQYAAIEALKGNQDMVNNMKEEFEKRKEYVVEMLNNLNNINFINPKGTFYLMIKIDKFFNKYKNEVIIKNSLDFSKLLLKEEKLAVIPGDAFGAKNYIRISFATSIDNIKEGLKRLETFLNSLN